MEAIVQQGPDRLGQTLGGRYELVEYLGAGSSSDVYRALQLPLRRSVAVKILSDRPRNQRRAIRRFINEARILSRLRHPHIIPFVDFGRTDDGSLFIVTDYVAGGSLRDLIKGRRVALRHALDLARQVARALAEAHAEGVIHRDIKPGNVLVERPRCGQLVARLIDFGLAADASDNDESAQAAPSEQRLRVGTPRYMSPEQAFFRPVDPTTDLYALGAILYEMVTGHPVFASESNEELYFEHAYSAPPRMDEVAPDLDIPADLEALIYQLLAKDPADRPSSAAQVAVQLEAMIRQLVHSRQVTTPAPPRASRDDAETIPELPRWRTRHPVLTGALLGGLSVALVLVLLV